MEKGTTTMLLFCTIVLICILGYAAGRMQQEPATNAKAHEVDSLINYSTNKEVEFKKKVDSVSIENRALKNANTLIEKSITKLLKQNEKNKANLLVMSDSAKLYIIDSMLRANGYR
jgi:ABC-type transport system involved in Fe-S cluster assembly fused permease/ATPase subunit